MPASLPRIGIGLPNGVAGTDGDTLLLWARRAEERGFASLATNDHVAYPGFDPIVPLVAAAVATEGIELLTNVLVLPLRSAVLTAKQVAGLAQFAGHRVTLGVAAGWRPADFELVGAALEGRGTRFDEALETLARSIAGEPLAAEQTVAPGVDRGTVPLLVGGAATLAAPRVARWGAGWTAGLLAAGECGDGIARITEAWRAAGRTGRPRIVNCCYAALDPDTAVEHYLREYYDDATSEAVDAMTAATSRDGAELRAEAEAQAAAGVTDLVVFPVTADPAEVDRVADVLLG